MLTKEQLIKLEKLSALEIDENKWNKFISKLSDVINLLDRLKTREPSDIIESEKETWDLSEYVFFENTTQTDPVEIMSNVKHPVLDNAITIKSSLKE